MNSAGQGRNRFAVSHLPAQFGAEDFSDLFAEAADFSDILLNFRIFAAQISVRQNRHCRSLDAELIDFSKRYGSGGKLVKCD
jgi:hypothetical protein